MKGLLLKDCYMIKKYCRAYLLLTVIFTVVSFFGEDNLFLIFYPCFLCGVIPVNLIAYDESSRWTQYSEALPYTRALIVSSKYLIGIFTQLAVIILTIVAHSYEYGRQFQSERAFDDRHVHDLHRFPFLFDLPSLHFQNGCGKRPHRVLRHDRHCLRRCRFRLHAVRRTDGSTDQSADCDHRRRQRGNLCGFLVSFHSVL